MNLLNIGTVHAFKFQTVAGVGLIKKGVGMLT